MGREAPIVVASDYEACCMPITCYHCMAYSSPLFCKGAMYFVFCILYFVYLTNVGQRFCINVVVQVMETALGAVSLI